MTPISKPISYGYSKSVQLFSENSSTVFIVVLLERDIYGNLYNAAEYRYDDYSKAIDHMRKIVINFLNIDLGIMLLG